MKIMIDCGHCLSGADTGAQGNGKKEEVLTREVGSLVKTYLLQQGHECELTEVNSGYTSVNSSLQARIDKEKAYKPDLFVSIHFNAGGGTGTETYVCSTSGQAYQYAKKVQAKIVELTGYRDRGVKTANYAVIAKTVAPAMLVECAFIDSANDMNAYNADTLAKAIVEGITGVKVENKQETSNQESKLYKVICGAFGVRENADRRVTELANAGYESYIESVNNLNRVVCGAFGVKENANKRAEELKNKGFDAYVE